MSVGIINQAKDAFVAAKSALNDPQKVFDEKVKSCFSKFVSVLANVFHISKAAVVIFKENGDCCSEMNANNYRVYQNE